MVAAALSCVLLAPRLSRVRVSAQRPLTPAVVPCASSKCQFVLVVTRPSCSSENRFTHSLERRFRILANTSSARARLTESLCAANRWPRNSRPAFPGSSMRPYTSFEYRRSCFQAPPAILEGRHVSQISCHAKASVSRGVRGGLAVQGHKAIILRFQPLDRHGLWPTLEQS